MLEPWRISRFYINSELGVPKMWNLTRKHVRIQLSNGRFIKVNKFRNRLNERELRSCCIKFSPIHVYFSVLNWLFPERVGKKYKARYAVPLDGEYVVDVDSYVFRKRHRHVHAGPTGVCYECLNISKALTIQACESIEEYYSDIAIVFSGRRGFHIHVLDFNFRDWTDYDEKNPVKSHEVARYKFTQNISLDTYVFDRAHFILSVDPMRVISVPNSLNAETGLKCLYIGNRKDLENISINALLHHSNPALDIYGYPEPAWAVK
jgi:DNA primase catalytic subunit